MCATQMALATIASEMVVDGVSKGFGIGLLNRQVLSDCSFTLEKAMLSVMIGPSGCGKTTLVNLLAGYETPIAARSTSTGRPFRAEARTGWSCFRKQPSFTG